MKIIRYLDPEGNVRHASWESPSKVKEITGDIFGKFSVTDEPAKIKKLLAPVKPCAIIGIGLNYRQHAKESGMPVPKKPIVFIKTNNTLQHPQDPIFIPKNLTSNKVDYEGELAVVIGKSCRNVSSQDVYDYILGYTCANDVSARDWQIEYGGGQWCRGKMFDTFAPIGPSLVTKDEVPDPHTLNLKTYINDQLVQDWRTDDMIFDIPTLIEFLSGSTTLYPGTVVLTGTPQGVGMAQDPPRWLKEGDTVKVEIEKIGSLSNPVKNEPI
jgi:2-keto-4-pentenoate hydratase/2-oxohepta-3-ene-1,7-dioic acid hydratase in catechol pathway